MPYIYYGEGCSHRGWMRRRKGGNEMPQHVCFGFGMLALQSRVVVGIFVPTREIRQEATGGRAKYQGGECRLRLWT